MCNCGQAIVKSYVALVIDANKELAASRKALCDACPLLSKKGFWGVCHCWMHAKTRNPDLHCPGFTGNSDIEAFKPKW